MFDSDSEDSSVSRRSILRTAAASTAGLTLTGSAGGQEFVPDDPAPGPNVTFLGFDCDPDREEFYTEVSREPTHDFGESEVVELDSGRDGEKVQLAVTWPKPLEEDAEPSDDYPVILRATPYVSDLRGYTVRDCIRTRRLAENYIQQGYAVAAVAVRGTGGSGGCMELMGPNEQADIDQAVTWLGENGRSNGNVAIIGRSYDGTTPWMPARKGNPYLATVVPFSGVPDIHELMYKRGAPETRGYAILNGLYYIISLAEHGPNSGTGLRTYLSRASCPDNYAQGTLWASYAGATGEYDPSGYWTSRVLKPGVARNYEGSILMVHGLQDWNVDPSQVYPWTKALREAGMKTHVYFGQFDHRYPDDGRIKNNDDELTAAFNPDWADFLLKWFESELKGRDPEKIDDVLPAETDDSTPTDPFAARVHAQASGGEWYTADEWPPAEAEPRAFYIGTDGDLRTEPSDETGEQPVYVDPGQSYNPQPGCRACVTAESEPFEETFRFAGEPVVDVTVTPTGPANHLTAHVYAVDEEGGTERLGWGQVDLRYAQDGPEAGTVVPGEELDVSLPIEPLDATVEAGQRLAVVLSQGTAAGRVESPTPTPVLVETGGDNGLFLRGWGGDLPAPEAVPTGTREVDASAYTGGQTSRQTVVVDTPIEGPVEDVVPASWNVYVEDSPDVEGVETDGDRKRVRFAEPASGSTTYEYFLEAPSGAGETNYYQFGPAEIRIDGEWREVNGTGDDAFVVGVET
jgi:putative CocE/NonD family hydrolase